MASSMRLLHAIHDFLPRHQAGSEIYADELCRELLARDHHVTVVCAEFDPGRPHGHVRWRAHRGIPVVEIANNWVCQRFEDTYRDPVMGSRIESVLRAVQPEVVHVHNLLNLTFDLPRLAKAQGAAVVATLHDYTLVCPSGGQRVHRSESHVCRTIEAERCARCFGESPFGTQAAWGRLSGRSRLAGPLTVGARTIRTVLPRATMYVSKHLPALPATADDVETRLKAARDVFGAIDLFVAPSASIARDHVDLGLPADRILVSDYGFSPRGTQPPTRTGDGPLRIGFVGTPAWHKGVHLLIDAAQALPPDRFTLTIAGDLDIFPDYVADLRQRARGIPVTFTGAVERRAIEAIYDRLDVLVTPSIWLENSPLVVHEALQGGLPVVAANIGGLPELVQHERNGLLFDAGSVDSLAASLRRLVDDRTLTRQLAAGGATVKSLATDATGWEDIYSRVTARMRAEAAS
jgi:glycosyltransferase involved in cell wall biosynthesis